MATMLGPSTSLVCATPKGAPKLHKQTSKLVNCAGNYVCRVFNVPSLFIYFHFIAYILMDELDLFLLLQTFG